MPEARVVHEITIATRFSYDFSPISPHEIRCKGREATAAWDKALGASQVHHIVVRVLAEPQPSVQAACAKQGLDRCEVLGAPARMAELRVCAAHRNHVTHATLT